jgi:circadian clock protein KaiC
MTFSGLSSRRVSSGVPGLNEMLYGGFITESAVLVRGAPGTGKTTIGLQYLLEGVRCGEAGLFVTFEEFPRSIYRDAQSFGWDIKPLEERGQLQILFTSPDVLLDSLSSTSSALMQLITTHNIRRVVLDSLTHFTRLTSSSSTLRSLYSTVINSFRREGITAMYLSEEMRSDFTSSEKGRLPFIVDCILLLRYLEFESAIQRGILVLKMRSSDHDKAIHRYEISGKGVEVGGPLEGRIGLLSGITQHSIISTTAAQNKR